MLFTMSQRITLHKSCPSSNYRGSIAGRNGILVEFYYLEESKFRVIAMSSCLEMGGAFSENLI